MKLLVTILALCGCVAVSGAARYVYYPPTGASDGNLFAVNANYATACGGAKTVDIANIGMTVGVRKGATYRVDKSFIRFDLTGLSDPIASDTLYMYCNGKTGTLDIHVFGVPDWFELDSGDWDTGVSDTWVVPNASISIFTWMTVASLATAGQINAFRIEWDDACGVTPPAATKKATFASTNNVESPELWPYLAVNTSDGTRHIIPASVTTQPTVNGLVRVTDGQ